MCNGDLEGGLALLRGPSAPPLAWKHSVGVGRETWAAYQLVRTLARSPPSPPSERWWCVAVAAAAREIRGVASGSLRFLFGSSPLLIDGAPATKPLLS